MRDDQRPLLLTDEHIPPHLGSHLIKMGYDVLAIRQTNVSKSGDGTSDAEVIELATELRRVVITNNRTDFEALHKTLSGAHCGIVICPVEVDDDLKKQAKLIHEQIEACGNLNGRLLRVMTVRTNQNLLREHRRKSARGRGT
jgi:predicted nuclease of predicted toxin-antitoxin system